MRLCEKRVKENSKRKPVSRFVGAKAITEYDMKATGICPEVTQRFSRGAFFVSRISTGR
jgi:hypothetical protein